MKVLQVIGALAGILFILVIGGCSIAAFSVGNSLDKSDKAGKEATKWMPSVTLGMTRAQVVSLLGKPESDQSFNNDYENSSCIYYGTLSENNWQLCFTNGRLDSKNRY